MSLELDKIDRTAVDGSPFSNSDQGYAWMALWCARCLRDVPFRNGINATGCPILLVAMTGKTPAQWLPGKDDARGYQCSEFRPIGTPTDQPRPRREPRRMDGLFARPVRQARTLVEPRAEQ